MRIDDEVFGLFLGERHAVQRGRFIRFAALNQHGTKIELLFQGLQARRPARRHGLAKSLDQDVAPANMRIPHRRGSGISCRSASTFRNTFS